MIRQEKACLILGYVCMLVALAGLFVFDTMVPVLVAPLLLGVALLTYAFYLMTSCKGGGDERMQKVIVFSMAYSWLTVLFFATMYVLMDMFGLLPQYTVMRTLSMTLFIMLLFFGTWYLYFQRKGDIE
jgi:hypothetical protein